MAKPWAPTVSAISQPIIPTNAIPPASQLNQPNPSLKSQSEDWEPPIRFTRVSGLQPPAFPLLEEEKLINEVTPLVIRDRGVPAAEDSEDETEIIESYPPLSFAAKEAPGCPINHSEVIPVIHREEQRSPAVKEEPVVPIIHREVPSIQAPQGSPPIMTAIKQDFPRFRVPPLFIICQKCETSQASDSLYTDQPCSQHCFICKRCVYQALLTGNPHCPKCTRPLADWEQDLIKAYGESLQL